MRIVLPIPIVTDTMIGDMLLGSICFMISRGTEQLIVCAASRYSIFLTPMIEPLSSLTVIGIPPMDSAMTVFINPLPRHAEMAIARRMPGIACRISTRRMITVSAMPPKYPTTEPIAIPMTVEMIVARKPNDRDALAP